ncbi:MAG: hypothetical protein HY245_05275 [Rhizobiales bacterium]|nr:hypothetical protein [Hyphomicrobiales bacterium]
MSRGKPPIAVVLAVHQPDPAHLREQLDSIVGQEDVKVNLHAVIDGDEAGDAAIRAMLAVAKAQILVNPARLGIRRTFAEGLRAALADSEAPTLRAYCFADQDDIWQPRKLSLSLAELECSGASLVHCDARLLAAGGQVVDSSLHRHEGREEGNSLLDHLLLNTVTGMTAMLTPQTARLALRLMDEIGSVMLHDHVAACAAAAIGSVRHLDLALVDYRQHEGNYMGAAPAPGWIRAQRGWLTQIGAYRQASAAIFADRRELLAALSRQMAVADDVAQMFLLGGEVGRSRLIGLYAAAMFRFLRKGQRRRARICLRLLDAALAHANRPHRVPQRIR